MHKPPYSLAVLLLVFGVITVSIFLSIQLATQHKLKSAAEQSDAKNQNSLPIAGENKITDKGVLTDYQTLWVSDFKGNQIAGYNKSGQLVWEQNMASQPIPPSGYNTHTEYVTVAPNGNLIVSDGEGMMVQEIDRSTHRLLWQYGIKDKQGSAPGLLHQPDKSYKINDHEVVINDGNNRRVIIVDQRTNDIVWQYGETLRMGSQPGLLRGNTSVTPLTGSQQFIITDTLDKKVIIVDRSTKKIVWEWRQNDAKWLQHVWPTATDSFVMEDRQANKVFEVDRSGRVLWTLDKLADGSALHYPTDAIKLGNGHVLIAEAGRGRVIEVNPVTGQLVNTITGVGYVTTIAIE